MLAILREKIDLVLPVFCKFDNHRLIPVFAIVG